ncbi:unnamed protein product [Calicophoron daubneyi]|uniref:Disease resistance R13L4/SHOC-2-like LRR domain-containing protein n=1 Tax=Calicophoron daubneyi TaxID=300641 RepID=A0AAV2TV67_CALDB
MITGLAMASPKRSSSCAERSNQKAGCERDLAIITHDLPNDLVLDEDCLGTSAPAGVALDTSNSSLDDDGDSVSRESGTHLSTEHKPEGPHKGHFSPDIFLEPIKNCDKAFKPIHGLVASSNLIRSPGSSFNSTADGPRKTVHLHDGKKFKANCRSSLKRQKPPDVSKELAQCRELRSQSLDLSNKGLNQIPGSAFKDLSFITKLFLYDNKLASLPSTIGHLSSLQLLLLQQNMLTTSGLPAEMSKLNKLEQLDLRHNRLENVLPPHICRLPNLQHLLLNFNKLTSLEGITNLKNLSVLVVSRNSIRQELPASIGDLTRLTTLDLSFNHITSLPDSIGNCTAMRDLNLQHNQLTRLPDTIGNLVNLIRLALKYNHLNELPASLSNCTKLDEFNVENNHLSSLPDGLLLHLPSLKTITLSRNGFETFPSGGPDQFKTCYSLCIDHNRITGIPQSMFSQAAKLTTLNLCDNGIDSLLPEDLCHWRSVVELDLGSNHLVTLPSEIRELHSLEVLRLNFNQLEILPDELNMLSKLRILTLDSNHLCRLPDNLSDMVSLQELNVVCNRLTTFPKTMGSLPKLKVIKAGENDIREVPPELGNLPVLQDLYLNDNPNLNSLPAELSLCKTLKILTLENCPLCDLPPPIVDGGSAMIIYFLQQVLQLRRQQTAL